MSHPVNYRIVFLSAAEDRQKTERALRHLARILKGSFEIASRQSTGQIVSRLSFPERDFLSFIAFRQAKVANKIHGILGVTDILLSEDITDIVLFPEKVNGKTVSHGKGSKFYIPEATSMDQRLLRAGSFSSNNNGRAEKPLHQALSPSFFRG